jgi:NAD(P)-dependent dehydrogenase (short-subunit alcohol dehydrogenase family)
VDSSRHAGRVAVVTGAGSGIGRATVLRLANEGATVFGCDVSAAGLHETGDAVLASGAKASLHEADITSQADVDRVMAEAMGHGPISLLANVAGIMDHITPLGEMDDAMWDRVLGVNITGTMRMCRAAVPSMVEAGKGSIVNIASIAGLTGGAAGTAYTTSKHAMIGLTRSIAVVYGPKGVRCNVICPGGVETNIGVTAAPRVPWAAERVHGKNPAALPIEKAAPDDIAALLSWVSSDEGRNINGTVLTSDGGRSAG